MNNDEQLKGFIAESAMKNEEDSVHKKKDIEEVTNEEETDDTEELLKDIDFDILEMDNKIKFVEKDSNEITEEDRRLTKEEQAMIAENNMALVNYVVKKFEGSVASKDELFSVGILGFAKALSSYDKTKKIKVSTYAVKCIRNEILHLIRKETKNATCNTSMNEVLSCDNYGNELTWESILSNTKKNEKGPDDILLEDENREVLLKALGQLKEKERIILMYRFGMINGEVKTQKEIANMINMSQANVSKIEKFSLHKLRLILRKDNY